MLYLHTGQPGNGKTLYTLWWVETQLRRAGGGERPVYYHKIPGVTLPGWVEFDDPRAWEKLPDGAIIVIDEAHKAFPKRPQGQKPPAYIENLAEHRHRGFDIVLITQLAKEQLDTFVRGLVKRHVHIIRRFGVDRATLYQWEEYSDSSSTNARKIAAKKSFPFPKDFYKAYRSASEHHVQKDFPWRYVALGVAALACVIGGALYARHNFMAGASDDVHRAGASGVGGGDRRGGDGEVASRAGLRQRAGGGGDGENPWSAELRAPRVPELAESAPFYDQLQKARSQPVVTGCMQLQIGDVVRCECTTDQGNIAAVGFHECKQRVKRGWFDSTRVARSAKAENIARLEARDQRALAGGREGPSAASAPAPLSPPPGPSASSGASVSPGQSSRDAS